MAARIGGCAKTQDGYHVTAPRPHGHDLERTIWLALADVYLTAREIERVEAQSYVSPAQRLGGGGGRDRVFGSEAPVTLGKGYLGRPRYRWDLEAILITRALRDSSVQPTARTHDVGSERQSAEFLTAGLPQSGSFFFVRVQRGSLSGMRRVRFISS